jgi:hypothetical protein
MKQSAAGKPQTEMGNSIAPLVRLNVGQPSAIPEDATGRDSHEALGTVGATSQAKSKSRD